MTQEKNHSEEQAKAQLASIRELVQALRDAETADDDQRSNGRDDAAIDAAREAIEQDALSVQVRSDWYTPGQFPDHSKPSEFEILLCTGGPACRLIGTLDEHCQPESVRIEHQDWGTRWTEYRVTAEEQDVLLAYCSVFYFGE